METEHRQLGDIAMIFVGMPTKQSQLKEYGPFGNVLTVRALGDFGIDRDQLVRVDLNARDVGKYQAKSGDLVLSARSTTLKMGVVPDELDGIIVNATLIGVRSMPALDPRLLAAYLSHPDGLAALDAVAQSATIQMNLTVSAVSKLEVPVPRLDVQRQVVEMLTASDTAYASAIEAAHTRRRLARRVAFDHILGQYSK